MMAISDEYGEILLQWASESYDEKISCAIAMPPYRSP